MSLFSRARDWLNSKLKSSAGVTVTYTRASLSVSVVAVSGRTVFVSTIEGGPRVEFGDRDFLIAVADLEDFGEPAIGDRIREVIDSTVRVFEVCTPGTGEPAWRYSDTGFGVYRIHTKLVSVT